MPVEVSIRLKLLTPLIKINIQRKPYLDIANIYLESDVGKLGDKGKKRPNILTCN
jgi:hypothetical protein